MTRCSAAVTSSSIEFAVLRFFGSTIDLCLPPRPDTFDLIRLFDAEGNQRFRTWQVKMGNDLLKIVHVDEKRTARTNHMWIPLLDNADAARANAPRRK